jgi:hypothetical protein
MPTFTPWHPLLPDALATVPSRPGVFQLATLVRTVVYIGASSDLAATLAQHVTLAGSPFALGRRYFRYVELEHPEQRQRELLEEFRRSHRGTLPTSQSMSPGQAIARRLLRAV